MSGACSVVVVSDGRRRPWLRRCIASLEDQKGVELEIICVCRVEDLDLARDDRVRFFHEPRPGVSLAKNVGWRAASHPIVAFTDDDCIPDPFWSLQMVSAFGAPEIDAAMGDVIPARDGIWHTAAPHGSGPRSFSNSQYPEWPWDPGSGNNMAIRRSALERLGGFDERFGPGAPIPSGEDLDIILRVLEMGRVVVRVPQARVAHEPLMSHDAVLRSVQAYRLGLGALFAKHHSSLRKGMIEYLLERDGKNLLAAARTRNSIRIQIHAIGIWSLFRGHLRWTAVTGRR